MLRFAIFSEPLTTLYAIYSECQGVFLRFFQNYERTHVMTLRERIRELCNKNNISMNQLEKELGFGKGYLSKLDKSKPNASKLQSIADYFHVSLDYLISGEMEKENAPAYDPEFLELMSLYSKLKKEQKEAVLNLMRSLALD